MSNKLKDRIDSYQAATDYKLLNRVPIVIVINGRAFSRVTQLLDKPYCPKFAECIQSTMLRLCSDIEGSLFGYQYNDEIVIVARNDQTNETTPWYDNKLQKICSVTSAIATMHFNECVRTLQLNLTGDPIFTSQVFVTPSTGEAVHCLVSKQQQNNYTSIQSACLYNLLNKYDRNYIKDMLTGLNNEDKIDLLKQECSINYNDYPLAFKRGSAAYKVPTLTKTKWHLNNELPIFTKDQSFLSNLFKNNGVDIFREDSLSR